jgi:hypothetical protein
MVSSNLPDAKFQTFQILFGVAGGIQMLDQTPSPAPLTPQYIYLFGFVHMAFCLMQQKRYVYPVSELFYP